MPTLPKVSHAHGCEKRAAKPPLGPTEELRPPPAEPRPSRGSRSGGRGCAARPGTRWQHLCPCCQRRQKPLDHLLSPKRRERFHFVFLAFLSRPPFLSFSLAFFPSSFLFHLLSFLRLFFFICFLSFFLSLCPLPSSSPLPSFPPSFSSSFLSPFHFCIPFLSHSFVLSSRWLWLEGDPM